MTEEHNITLEWSGELVPVIDPDTGKVEYVMHQEGESLLMALITHMMKKEREQ